MRVNKTAITLLWKILTNQLGGYKVLDGSDDVLE